MENKPKLADILANLGDEEHIIDAVVIYGLSGLDSNQVAQMAKAWPGYSVERRRKLLQMLNEASESNFELDFRAINHMALDDPDGETRRYLREEAGVEDSLHVFAPDADAVDEGVIEIEEGQIQTVEHRFATELLGKIAQG